MICIKREHTDPYFNLAAEEYVLKNFREDVFMLWQNDPCIVVGKHQNTWAEINPVFAWENQLPVVRRITGGGAVYHDQGNLNFTFVRSGTPGSLVDFKRFTQPVIEVLAMLGVKAEFAGHNSLLIGSRKFSGNAEHVYRNRVLHHGTMLYSSNLNHLKKALQTHGERYTDKAVGSVPHRVTNISEYLKNPPDISTFKSLLLDRMTAKYTGLRMMEFNDRDIDRINSLAENRYKTFTWNFGRISKYMFHHKINTRGNTVDIAFEVNHGIIGKVTVPGGINHPAGVREIEHLLTGVPHHPGFIRKLLLNTGLYQRFGFTVADDMVRELF